MSAYPDTVGPHRPGVMEQAVDDELILYNPESESYFTLNRTAREVWELADGTVTEGAIAATLADRYGIDAATVASDVAAIVDSFRGAQLID